MSGPPYQPSYDCEEEDAIMADADACPECGRTFKSAQAVAIHRGRAHQPGRAASTARRAKRNGKPDSDDLRDLVAKLDRRAELQAELVALELSVDRLQTRLAKKWQP